MFLSAINVSAQVTVEAKQESAFKKIDFLNYEYPSGNCGKEFGFPAQVRIQNGRSMTKELYFYIPDNKIAYGDVTGDKRTDAVIHVACGGTAGNFSLAEIYVFMQTGGKAKLLATIDTARLEADYKRYFPEGFIVGVVKNGVKLYQTHIMVEVYTDGSNASPKYISTLEYHLNGAKPSIGSKPRRRASGI